MTNKYAVIFIEHFNRQEIEGVYSIVNEHDNYALIEYVTEPDPIGEHWVIFEGEDANVRCAEYLNNINEN